MNDGFAKCKKAATKPSIMTTAMSMMTDIDKAMSVMMKKIHNFSAKVSSVPCGKKGTKGKKAKKTPKKSTKKAKKAKNPLSALSGNLMGTVMCKMYGALQVAKKT